MKIHSLRFTAAMVIGGALALSGCSAATTGTTGTAGTDRPADPSPSAPGTSADGTGTPRDTDIAGAEFTMSWRDALDAAAARFDGDPVSLSLEWKRTAFAYGVELVSDTESYEAVFNADTGELVYEETERESAGDIAEKRLGLIAPDAILDPGAAMASAVAAVKGPVEEWEIDEEDGRVVYEVQIVTDTGDVDVTVDATSGEVLKVDH